MATSLLYVFLFLGPGATQGSHDGAHQCDHDQRPGSFACSSNGSIVLLQTAARSITRGSIMTRDDLYIETEGFRADGRFGGVNVHMDPEERELFYKMVNQSSYYLEFGAGGSTAVVASSPNIKKAYSVESDPQWVSLLKKEDVVSRAIADGRLELMWADTGAVGDWSYPKDNSSMSKWPNYSAPPLDDDFPFDTVLVDGRFRVACFLKTLRRIAPERRKEIVLMVHDYTIRKDKYRAMEDFADIAEQTHTLTVFKKKADVDSEKLDRAISEHDFVVGL